MKKNILKLMALCVVCALFFTVKSCKNPELSLNDIEAEQLQSPALTRSGGEWLAWDYPVKQSMEEWRQFTSYAQMVQACLVPADVLARMTTEELISVCIDYPLRFKFYLYDNLQTGFKRVTDDFNGLQELLMRKDNVQCLINMLHEIDLETLPQRNLSNIEIGNLIVSHTFVEAMLSHERVMANTTSEQQRQIAALTARNVSLKEQWTEAYSWQSFEASAYLLCAGLKRMNGNIAPDLEIFLQTGSLRNNAQINALKSLSQTLNR